MNEPRRRCHLCRGTGTIVYRGPDGEFMRTSLPREMPCRSPNCVDGWVEIAAVDGEPNAARRRRSAALRDSQVL